MSAEMIPPAEADALLASLPRTPDVTLPLARCPGRVLREPVTADRPQPPFDRVAMDGIAFAFADWERGARRFPVEATQKAGDRPRRLAREGACLKVMTGAVLPEGTDCIAPVEEVRFGNGEAALAEGFEAAAGRFVHRAGSDCAAGEILVSAGTVLEAPHLGAAASCGRKELPVAETPTIAIIATGDELVDPGRPPMPHQIRRSNPSAIEAALRKRRFERVGSAHCRDDLSRLKAAAEGALARCDVLILTGGVSMGDTDHVPAVLKELDVRPVFHKIRQKPGKPFWFGMAPGDKPVFGLPGNPASVLVCLHRYVLPALARAMGAEARSYAPMPCVAEGGIPSPGKLTQFIPAVFAWGDDGRLRAVGVPNRGSGDFTAWGRAQGFVEVPAETPAGGVAAEARPALRAWMW